MRASSALSPIGFSQDVLPRLRGPDRPRDVKLVRQRIVDGVDLRILHQLLVGAIRPRNAERRGRAPPLGSRRDSCHGGTAPPCMAGITFAVAIRATPSTPHRTVSLTSSRPSLALRGIEVLMIIGSPDASSVGCGTAFWCFAHRGRLGRGDEPTSTTGADSSNRNRRRHGRGPELVPLLYGQFAEFMFEGIKGGLSAELIRNRGFEDRPSAIGLSHHWERYPDDRNDDYAISFGWDETVAYGSGVHAAEATGGHSLRIQLRPGVVARHGVFQPRVPVREGLDYRGYLWIKSDAFTGGVSVSLEADVNGGRIYDGTDCGRRQRLEEVCVRAPAGRERSERALRDPRQRRGQAVGGSGVAPAGRRRRRIRRGGSRRSEGARPVHPLAWRERRPGLSLAMGIGPRDERPSWVNPSWNNEVEPADFGTDEFVRFARLAGAEPSITVNVEERRAAVDEAAAWVEYCNGPATSRYRMMRAGTGIGTCASKCWEIGNEIWGDWVRGHSDAVTYARNLTSYVARMRAVDSSIR